MHPYCLMLNMTMPDDVMENLRKIVRPISIDDVIENSLYDDVVVAVASPMLGMDDEWFDRLPNLKLLAIFGVGIDKINLKKASERNITVTTTINILTREVADLAIALILSLTRRLVEADQFVRSSAWAKGNTFPLGKSLYGKRLGIIGLGKIGHETAKRGEAFGMQPRYYSRIQKADASWPHYKDITELAENSDVLVASISATSDTEKVIDAKVFEALGMNGIFINIARGAVVDEEALISALKEMRIAGAGLDVFWNEPDINPEFFKLNNVLLVPHQGSATEETRFAMGMNVVENIQAILNEKPALTKIN